MGKTSNAAKRRYNEKAYDRIAIIVPKGRKKTLEAFCAERGESINGLTNALYMRAVGLSADEWKAKAESDDPDMI